MTLLSRNFDDFVQMEPRRSEDGIRPAKRKAAAPGQHGPVGTAACMGNA